MFTKLNSVKALKTLIKLAAVALTSPATVSVAGSLYPTQPITKVIVSISALILIEGCLLLGWQMLDRYGKNATMIQRWLYAGLMWIAYLSLFGIALYHNEGGAGFAFRATLGVMLLYASIEAGLLAEVKRNRRADQDIQRDWWVRRYARKLARRSAIADLELDAKMHRLDREIREELYTLQVKRESKQQMQLVKSNEHKPAEMAKSDTSLDRANQKRRLSKQQAINKTLEILSEEPDASLTDIARQIGRSRQTVYDYLKELERSNLIHRNGHGILVSK
jgi:predicted transcriptional regulator